MKKKVTIIGAGFSGLSAACFMAKAGWEVHVIERHAQPGGRARQFSEAGFTFDMGPSWYWMPDVFESFFSKFGKSTTDYYKLTRLDPSYRIYWKKQFADVPADYPALKNWFESIEPGAGKALDRFLEEAKYKYETGIKSLVLKPGQSWTEFLDMSVIKGILRLDVFTSMKKHVGRYFKDSRLVQVLEFPVLFLGALPENTPALYSLMNYADIIGGTWYPEHGMYSIVNAMYQLACELGVNFHFNTEVSKLEIADGKVVNVVTEWMADGRWPMAGEPMADGRWLMAGEPMADGRLRMAGESMAGEPIAGEWRSDINREAKISHPPSAIGHPPAIGHRYSNPDYIIASADYHHVETVLLEPEFRTYSEKYWESRVMAPSSLLYYVGLNKKLNNLRHHSLFFDTVFDKHAREIYQSPQWPEDPLFYVSATSVTDPQAAPQGCENLFFLIPIAAGLGGDNDEIREKYFQLIIRRMEAHLGQSITESIIFKRSFGHTDFINEYHSFKGNAYGLANTLMQTAILKPSCRSRILSNLFYAGQLTIPGPGVPPSLISGEVVAGEVIRAGSKR